MNKKGDIVLRKSFTFEGRRYFVRGKDDSDLAVKIAMRKRDLEEQKKTVSGKMLVKNWIKTYLETYKINAVADVTYKDIISRINKNITSEIGSLLIKDVRPIHCQKILNNLAGFSSNHIKKVKNLMIDIFEKALDNGLMLSNPALKLISPKGHKSTRRAITDGEREYILKVAEYNRAGLWILVMLYCGLRPSETSLIQGRHLNFKDKTLHIEGTKTNNANRLVPLPAPLLEKLPKIDPFDYLFKNQNGDRTSKANRDIMWKSFKRDLNIEMGCQVYRNQVIPPYRLATDLVPYCLRHTYCTDLQSADVPINIAKELMGHSDISLTASIYTHKSETAFNNVAEKINKFHEKNEDTVTKTVPLSL